MDRWLHDCKVWKKLTPQPDPGADKFCEMSDTDARHQCSGQPEAGGAPRAAWAPGKSPLAASFRAVHRENGSASRDDCSAGDHAPYGLARLRAFHQRSVIHALLVFKLAGFLARLFRDGFVDVCGHGPIQADFSGSLQAQVRRIRSLPHRFRASPEQALVFRERWAKSCS